MFIYTLQVTLVIPIITVFNKNKNILIEKDPSTLHQNMKVKNLLNFLVSFVVLSISQ